MKVFDCFTFFNEFDLLEIRLRHLWDFVDHFVLVEGDHTQRGQPKRFLFDDHKERYAWAADKIIHIRKRLNVAGKTFRAADSYNPADDNWSLEFEQREAISEALHLAGEEDLILVSDLDEIPSHLAMRELGELSLRYPVINLRQRLHWFFLDYQMVAPTDHQQWSGTCVCRKRNLTSPQDLRNKRVHYPPRLNGGYHFSNLGGIKGFIQKSTLAAHSEFDRDFFRDPRRIAENIRTGRIYCYDIPYHLERYDIDADPFYPEWIRRNRERYRFFFHSEESMQHQLDEVGPIQPLPLEAILSPDVQVRYIIETVFRLDAAGDIGGLLAFVQNRPYNPHDLNYVIYRLLSECRVKTAYLLAMLLANSGYVSAVIAFVRGIGGILFDNPQEEKAGLAGLAPYLGTAPEQIGTVTQMVIEPVLRHLQETVLGGADAERVARLLDVFRIVLPESGTRFDPAVRAAPVDPEEMARSGRERAALTDPPVACRFRRVVVALPFGERMATAMRNHGWEVTAFPLRIEPAAADLRTLGDLCLLRGADLLVLDDDMTRMVEPAFQFHLELVNRLRRERPGFQVVLCLEEAWGKNPYYLQRAAALVDVVWSFDSPSLPIWNEPVFANKLLQQPFPVGAGGGADGSPLEAVLHHAGGVRWNQAFWLAAAAREGLPVVHAARPGTLFGATSCRLNLASCTSQRERVVVTAGAFSTLLDGALLVQEATPELDRYLIAGAHYLAFSTLAELSAVVRFIAGSPEEAEGIRQRGRDFARERYADSRLIGVLDAFLDRSPRAFDVFKHLVLIDPAKYRMLFGTTPP